MKDFSGNLKRLFSSEEIKDCVEDLGKRISNQYAKSNPIFIGVLNGSFIFMADLMRSVTIDCEVDFIKVRSYSGKKSSGTIKLLKDISCDIKGRDVIIVEDIIDTGLSIKFLYERMLGASPKSIAIATFLHKPNKAKLDFPIDYIGFEIPNKFVVGYGLDFNQKMRHLDGLYYIHDGSNI